MSGSATRHDAVEAVTSYEIPHKDFAEPLGQLFGKNVFDLSRMKSRLPKSVYNSVLATIEKGAPARPGDRRLRGLGHAGLGPGERRVALRPRLLPADRSDGGEARLLPGAGRERQLAGPVHRQDPDAGRAGRLELPQRRHPQHLRGSRLHRLGRDQPGVHPGEPEREHPVHPHGVHLLDRRGAGQEDPPAALAAGDERAGRAAAEAVRSRQMWTPWCPTPAPSRSTS